MGSEINLRAPSAIRLCLAMNVLANVQEISSVKELWEKQRAIQAKDFSNRLLLN